MLGTVGNKNDADLIPANIKDGEEIFGVGGSLISGLPGLDTSIVASQSNLTSCSGAWSRIAETATDIYFIYSSSGPDGSGGGYPYIAHVNVVRYNKSSETIISVGTLTSGTSFYTSSPSFMSAYQDGNEIYVNFQGYQVVGIFTINTDTNSISFSHNSTGGSGTPETSGTIIADSLVYGGTTLNVNTYPLPRTSTPGYGTNGYIGYYYIT